jgi:DNA-binding SARP family transcriptional activator
MTKDHRAAGRIELFGGLRVKAGDVTLILPAGKLQSLLVFLLLSPNAQYTREVLLERLWPDATPERGRRNLSDTLYRLRQIVPAEWLRIEGDTLALNPAALWVDLWHFERQINGTRAEVEAAVELYSGILAPEIYDDWIIARRVACQEHYLLALLRLAEEAETEQDYGRAEQLYRRVIDHDSLREEAHRGLMRSLAQHGELAAALEVYDRLVDVLESELDAPPSVESRRLAEHLYRELELARQAAARPLRRFFVGRVGERSRLLARIEQARWGQGGIAVLLGEAGMGKTSLLHELESAAGWRGWHVYWGRSQELALHTPYAPLQEALAAALPPVRVQQVASLVHPARLAPVAGWLPSLAAVLPPAPSTTALAEPAQLEQALTLLLHNLQRIAPHLFLLDDVQWGDPALWPLLDRLHGALAEMRVQIVLNARFDELQNQADAWDMVTRWDQAGHTPVVRLAPMESDDLAKVIEAHGYAAPTGGQLAGLQRASGGNPLLALALVHSGGLGGDLGALLQTRPSLASLALRRFAHLSGAARPAAEAAAILGFRFAYPIWQTACSEAGIPAQSLPELAGELEQQGVLALEGAGYRFAHDTLRAAIVEQMAPRQRMLWHRHALVALQRHTPDDALALLYHAHAAGFAAETAQYALVAGEHALNSFAYRAAVEHFSLALAQLPADDLRRRYDALRGRSQAHAVLAQRAEQDADLRQLREWAEALDDDQRRAEVFYLLAYLRWTTGELAEAQAFAARGLEIASALGDGEREAALLEVSGRVARDRKEVQQAYDWIAQARARYQESGNHLGAAVTLDLLGGLAWDAGDYATAAANHRAAADLFHELGDILREAQALNNLGSAYWSLGDYAAAHAVHERALAVCREAGDRRGEADNIDNMGGVFWVLGDYDRAIAHYQEALAIRRAIDDRWGAAISLGNLGSAYRLRGDLDTALLHYEQAYPLYQAVGRQRGVAYVIHGRGMTLLAMGKTADALAALNDALSIRTEVGDRKYILESQAALAVAYLAAGDDEAARRYLDLALAALQPATDQAELRQEIYFAAYQVHRQVGTDEAARRYLALAAAALDELCATMPEADRQRFLTHVPLNREVQAALAAYVQRVTVRLARLDTPLGRKLADGDYVAVCWTIATPQDDLIEPASDRRRAALRRLAHEAAAQGAAPTDDDLAQALKISRRTVLRDIEALAQAGIQIVTRARAAQTEDHA